MAITCLQDVISFEFMFCVGFFHNQVIAFAMGTYSNRSHIMPETNNRPSVSHFGWFYGGNFFSAPKFSLQHGPLNQEHGLAVPPLRAVSPMNEPEGSESLKMKVPKVKKYKPSTETSEQNASKDVKLKKPRKKASSSGKGKGQSLPVARKEKKDLNMDFGNIEYDFSGVPSPYCSCTGTARVCYKWGAGGWQSSCCTISISEYPLPMSPSRPGARMAGRKMSNGAYVKLLLRLASEGHDLANPVDLKDHWARHGTNKFVTIK